MKNRSVIEIMVLIFTFVVGFAIVGTGTLIAILEIRDPDTDTGDLTKGLLALVSAMLGALLGLIAGKASGSGEFHERPQDDSVDDL
jgi:hypothetical protein